MSLSRHDVTSPTNSCSADHNQNDINKPDVTAVQLPRNCVCLTAIQLLRTCSHLTAVQLNASNVAPKPAAVAQLQYQLFLKTSCKPMFLRCRASNVEVSKPLSASVLMSSI